MSLKQIQAALAQAGEHLGDLVWWQLSNAEVPRSELERLWSTAGLDRGLLPESPTAERALKAAAKESQVGHVDYLVRLGKEDPAEVVFAIVHESREADGSLSYTQEARVRLDRIREHLVTDSPSHQLVAAICSGFERLRLTHTTDDVRRAVTKTLRSFCAVPLRESGGIYWVPRVHAEALRRLQTAIESIGSSSMFLLPVHDSADAARTLGQVAQASVEAELTQLKFEIEGFVQSPPERPSTLMRRLEAFESLRSKAELYRDILKVQVNDLDSQLASLTTTVEHLLDSKFAA